MHTLASGFSWKKLTFFHGKLSLLHESNLWSCDCIREITEVLSDLHYPSCSYQLHWSNCIFYWSEAAYKCVDIHSEWKLDCSFNTRESWTLDAKMIKCYGGVLMPGHVGSLWWNQLVEKKTSLFLQNTIKIALWYLSSNSHHPISYRPHRLINSSVSS